MDIEEGKIELPTFLSKVRRLYRSMLQIDDTDRRHMAATQIFGVSHFLQGFFIQWLNHSLKMNRCGIAQR
jgi:hypothetical protein